MLRAKESVRARRLFRVVADRLFHSKPRRALSSTQEEIEKLVVITSRSRWRHASINSQGRGSK